MSAQPAYSLYPERAVERAPRTRISVVPGQRTRSAAPASTVTPGLGLKAAIIVRAVLALVGIASLTLSAATVTTSMQSQALSSQIDDARAQGSSLEVTQSLLSNSTRVRMQAEKLGMAAPAEVGTINMPEDVVSTNDDGSLSLSRSVETATNAGE